MAGVRILACSETGMPQELAESLGITLVPYYVTFLGETREELDIDPVELYRSMRSSTDMPTTAHPSLDDYRRFFRDATDDGSSVVYISLSASYSNAYEMANLAREELEGRDIRVVDVHCATAEQGLLTILAAQFAQDGASADEVVAFVEEASMRTRVLIVFETLKYLARGGRIHKAQSLLGSIMRIKPVLTYNEEGMTEPFGRVRTAPQGLDLIVRQITKDLEAHSSDRLNVVIDDADAREWAEKVRERIQQEFTVSQLWQWTVSPIVGSHIGPGAWGVAYHCV